MTIDMAGHTLTGPGASSGHGIYQFGYRNLHLFNGKVIGWSGLYKGGIYTPCESAVLSDLQVSTNYYGILVGSGSTISRCTARDNESVGIYAEYDCKLSDCVATHNNADGIHANNNTVVSGCIGNENGNDGIYVIHGLVTACSASGNGNDGINMSGGVISDCIAGFNGGDGIEISYDSRVVDCRCDNNGFNSDGAGIHVINGGNRIDGNNVTDNDRGIDVDVAGNFIVRNTASGNTVNYDIAVSNDVGSIRLSPVTAGAWDNFEF